MGQTRDQMTQALQLKGLAEKTQREYVRCARQYVAYHMRPAEEMGEAEVGQFLMHLLVERKLSPASRKMYAASLRFLYADALRRPEVAAGITYPKVPQTLPDILSGSEVSQIFAAIDDIKYRAIVMTAYGAGLRISEVCHLRIDDIQSQRMLIHVRHAKGGRARFVPLPERVLFTLRRYYAETRPTGKELFPGKEPGRCISVDAVRAHLHKAVEKAGLKATVTPHLLRHSFATHLLELGTDLRVIQMLLGHSSIRTTLRYTRVTDKHVARIQSPVDVLGTAEAKKKIG
jgi:integrase/recombinase XerD